jgi:arginase family enzyme
MLGMINLDAHLDVRAPNPLRNSGTSFRMLIDEGSVRAESFVELGIQPYVNSERHLRWLTERGARIVTLDEVHAYGALQQIDAALQIATAGVDAFYGTLDIDAVRASEAPGVSAPLPDGISGRELLEIATALGRCPKTVALDVVEVNPRFDRDNATARLAAHAIVRFIEGVRERGGG